MEGKCPLDPAPTVTQTLGHFCESRVFTRVLTGHCMNATRLEAENKAAFVVAATEWCLQTPAISGEC